MRVSNEVLAVLSTVVVDGPAVRIEDQLERKLYQKTNEVLSALGGAWNRKAKAHLFNDDPREALEQVIATGEVSTHRDLAFFPTPAHIARALVRGVSLGEGDVVLEPSAGDGAIVRAVHDLTPAFVVAVEIDPKRLMALGTCDARRLHAMRCDFLDCTYGDLTARAQKIDAVIMNPPFKKVGIGDHLEHVVHAHGMLKDGGELRAILPAGVVFREDRRHREFRAWALARGTWRPLDDDAFAESGTRVRTVVLSITKGGAA
jgi:phospholipid N-methyltransferase